MKVNKHISLDLDVVLELKKHNIQVSSLVNSLLKKHLMDNIAKSDVHKTAITEGKSCMYGFEEKVNV